MIAEMKIRYDDYVNKADSEYIKEYNELFLCLIEQYERHLKVVYEACEKLTQDESHMLAMSILCFDYYNKFNNSRGANKYLFEFLKTFSTIPEEDFIMFTNIEEIEGFILFLINKDKKRKEA